MAEPVDLDATERREPATEAGRELLGKHLDYERSAEYRFMLDSILAIEAQATDARVAALVEALQDMAAAEENEQKRAYMRRLLADLLAAEPDRRMPLDVKGLERTPEDMDR